VDERELGDRLPDHREQGARPLELLGDGLRARARPECVRGSHPERGETAEQLLVGQLSRVEDELEDAIVDRADPEQLRRIYALKHSVTQLRQLLGAERDLFQRLITESLSDPDLGAYYRDVYDHVIRQYESVDSLRDLLTGAMDVYLSTVSNRLNVTMRTLTVIASLFLPITFLTGFYGMNFAYLTSVLEPHQLAFPIAIGTMLAATAFQLYIFKRRGWI